MLCTLLLGPTYNKLAIPVAVHRRIAHRQMSICRLGRYRVFLRKGQQSILEVCF